MREQTKVLADPIADAVARVARESPIQTVFGFELHAAEADGSNLLLVGYLGAMPPPDADRVPVVISVAPTDTGWRIVAIALTEE